MTLTKMFHTMRLQKIYKNQTHKNDSHNHESHKNDTQKTLLTFNDYSLVFMGIARC